MAELGIASGVIAVIQLTEKVASMLCRYGEAVKSAKDDIARFQKQLRCLAIISESAQSLLGQQNNKDLETSHRLEAAYEDVYKQLQILEHEICKTRKSVGNNGFEFRFVTRPFSARQMEKMIRNLEQSVRSISIALQIDQTSLLLRLDHTTSLLNQVTLLGKLPVAEGAAFDSHTDEHEPTCHPETRIELLQDLYQWVTDPCSVPIFWLNGMAGTGKSTISRTFARLVSVSGLPTASFFFKKSEGDRGRAQKFVTTIVTQFAATQPRFATHVEDAITKDLLISQKSISYQFRKLILEPFLAIQVPRNVVIVIDALDECRDQDDIKTLLPIFGSTKMTPNSRLRFLITSRPELSVRLGLNIINGTYQESILHEVPMHIIKHDIAIFLAHELGNIRIEFNNSVSVDRRLAQNWPAQEDVETLVEMAVPLFIFAATLCRFLADRKTGNPHDKLMKILSYRMQNIATMLHATYIPILEQQLVGLCSHERNLAIQQIRDIVGSIVLLGAPLTTSAIAALLSISKVVVDDRLDFLHSVLSIPATHTSPVKLLHLSFRDFFFDPTHKDRNPCWVDDQQVHQKLATHCVRLLNDGLSRDICELDWPGKPNVEVSLETIRTFFSAEVQYACRFWVYHLQKAGQSINDDDIVHQFLLHKFLYWIEACSLLDMVSECVSNIKSLQSLLMPETAPNLRLFLRDAFRFLLACAPAIKSAPLQTYSSAIFFAPKTSVIRNVFWDYRPSWISLLLTANEEWTHCEQTLDGHDDGVTSVVFSHDSKLLISGSRDRTVRVWLAQSGELLRTLRGHKSAVKSVAVSHDSEFIVSASQDKTVRIWSTSTGELRSVIPHCGPVSIATVSHDSKQIATASTDTAVRVWAVHTGELQRMVKCHDEAINSISFSHDSALIASASDDKTVRVFSTDTGEVQLTLGGHDSIVTSVAFSDDSIYIASGSYDYTAIIWSANTGTLIWKLKGHHGPVTSVAFSPGSHLVASASFDQSVRIWSAMTGELQQTFGDHRSWVSSISISGDLNRVASASMDRKIRIWQIDLVGLHQSPQVSHLQTTWPFASISLSLRPRKEAVHKCMPDTTKSSHKSLHVYFLKDRELHEPRNMRTLMDLSAMAAKHCPLSEKGPNPFENNANGACGPGISADLSWVTWGGRNLLWLPDEFRPWCSAVVGSCIIIGCDAGKVFMVQISQ